MAQLTFDFRHYTFEHGLRMLEKGYTAARDALLAEIERTEADALAYEKHVEDGGERIGEWEDGYRLWEQDQVYSAQIDDVHRALYEVRKAFVIALYHHWERSATAWKGEYASHEELEAYCASQGFGPSPDLDAVRHLTNHLKHGPHSRTDWLGKMRADYPTFMPRPTGPLFANIFGLSDDDLHKVAAVILASGPPQPNKT